MNYQPYTVYKLVDSSVPCNHNTGLSLFDFWKKGKGIQNKYTAIVKNVLLTGGKGQEAKRP